MTGVDRLRVAVVGAGVLGCHLGGLLASRCEVVLVGREHVVDPVREHGLTVQAGSTTLALLPPGAVRATTDPSAVQGADLVLVTTKSGSTVAATRQMAPFVDPGTVVVGFQNGLHGADLVREGVEDCPVFAGMVPFNVARVGPSTYRRTSAGRVVVDADPELAPLVAAAQASGIDVGTSADMPSVLHGKVLMNLNNAVQALSGLPLRQELLDAAHRRSVALCQREALRVFLAAGVVPHVPLPLPARLLPVVMGLPTQTFRLVAAATLRVDPEGTSSMADDLERGRVTEVDDLQGEIVRMGARLGVPAPACARVVELVHEAERAGTGRHPWSGPLLLAELRAARRSSARWGQSS